ncbi:zonular occludens toxin domain-containing protein [Pseudomonas sp. GV071]|uniref:zonular occludens toxin domain-containing protein n=1 Tax=Pseudomonas sp. GV071 TaxID=2135754 RepID=UPI000D340C7D|nr:zonular occludens toxin domain-containing protein [Pseudomonas sp. GV071]PTQ67890.1 zona occludens toxin [Pseudomonas sp. GV071]
MAIKIHHGPNGSYKTSGAIQDDAVRALKAGRLIITNIRGFTLERVLQVMPELPESVDIINLDLEVRADMEKMRSWFQWAPRGAFIIFDETQLVFPKAWREKDLAQFDFPGGSEAAAAADRPMDWLDGWTRHRHWNWDVVLTTPNISYIRDDIRMTSEMAYKHSNLAVIGISGRYKEAQHDAQLNRAPAEGTIIEYKRIKPDTFKLYQSTATGVSQDTTAGKSFWRQPKLLFLLAFIAAVFVAVFSLGGVDFGPANAHKETPAPAAVKAAPPGPAPAQNIGDVAADVLPVSLGGRQAAAPPVELNHPFAPRSFVIRAILETKTEPLGLVDVVDESGAVLRQSLKDLAKLGYQVRVRSPCLVDISHPLGFKGQATCPGIAPQVNQRGQRVEMAGINAAPTITQPTTQNTPPEAQTGTRVVGIPYTPAPRTLLD